MGDGTSEFEVRESGRMEKTKRAEYLAAEREGIVANEIVNESETEGNPSGREVVSSVNNNRNSFNTTCGFKMDKPKMPRFAGDVTDYAIFRSDFKQVVGTRCSKRDEISLLRSSLQGRPLELIKGIGYRYGL